MTPLTDSGDLGAVARRDEGAELFQDGDGEDVEVLLEQGWG
jgi:hypothetical protein